MILILLESAIQLNCGKRESYQGAQRLQSTFDGEYANVSTIFVPVFNSRGNVTLVHASRERCDGMIFIIHDELIL